MQHTSTLRVNLLPWREQARDKKRRQFYIRTWLILGVVVVFLTIGHVYLSMKLSEQTARNTFLQEAITSEQADITNLSQKTSQKAELLKSLNAIVSLRKQNYATIAFLNEIATVVPASIQLTRTTYSPLQATLEGTVNNNEDITQFMQQLAKSKFFSQPVLTSINDKSSEDNLLKFQLKVGFRENAA